MQLPPSQLSEQSINLHWGMLEWSQKHSLQLILKYCRAHVNRFYFPVVNPNTGTYFEPDVFLLR